MKRNLPLLLTGLLLLAGLSVFGQSAYYWSDGKQISLFEDRSTLVLHFQQGISPETAMNPHFASSVDIHQADNRVLVHFAHSRTESIDQLLGQLSINPASLRSAAFGWMLDDGFSVVLTHEVVLQFNPGYSLADLSPRLSQHGARYLRTDFKTFVLEVDQIEQVLPLANALRESGMTSFAHPDFYAKVTHYADPLYPEQFQMNNTGQTIDGFPGANDADCNAPEAWASTLGSSSITVAVIDDGVEDHEDLNDGGGASRVIGGYTPLNGGNGAPNSSGQHGQACSGIIAASHNGLGVQGLAPEVKLLTVNIFAGSETSQDIANGITWAKNNGADVMSNSWGYTSCTANFSNLTNAINDAVNNGRGGLGCVVIFASGNGYKSCVDYPADLPSVIAVGAFGNDGIKSDYSNAGPTLDIAAPSNDVSSQGFLSGAGVRTIDRMGSSGYSSGNYTTTFGGTSAACPVVAGVAALVLSVDATLTDAQVKSILYSTAIDMGASGFDNSYGNGRVNAGGAVAAAAGGGGGSCTSTVSSFPYNESFESGTGAWTQATGDDLDWTRRSGGTPSSGTGPSGAADGSWYMYIEASSPNYPTKTANFVSPCYDISGLSNPEFSFQYHMLGNSVGTLNLQASTDGTNWTTIWTRSGTQGSSWNSTTVDLATYGSATELSLRFNGTTGSSWQGDMCVDQLALASGGGGGGGCTDNEVTLTLVLDNYPGETSWEIKDGGGATVASGSGYSTAGATVIETACLVDGCYDFIIYDSYGDGICCAYGSGSYLLEDAAGNTLASGGAFTSSETTNFCLPFGGGGGSCPTIDFNTYTINSYGGNQDQGTSQVQDAGATLFIANNAWKSIDYAYTVTANTVVEFDFRSTIQGEIHGLGFDNNSSISSNRTFRVYGTQNWGIGNYDDYSGTAWKTYTIPVGTFYTGTFNRLFFVADHDGGARNGNAYFRNVKVYEGSCSGGANLVLYDSPFTPLWQSEGEYELSLYPNPVQDLLHLDLSGSHASYSAGITDVAGREVAHFYQLEAEAKLDLSRLSPGIYFLTAYMEDGAKLTRKFVVKP